MNSSYRDEAERIARARMQLPAKIRGNLTVNVADIEKELLAADIAAKRKHMKRVLTMAIIRELKDKNEARYHADVVERGVDYVTLYTNNLVSTPYDFSIKLNNRIPEKYIPIPIEDEHELNLIRMFLSFNLPCISCETVQRHKVIGDINLPGILLKCPKCSATKFAEISRINKIRRITR